MKISVVTVCFNSAKTIEDTLISVLSQTYTNKEHLIIDGASTDNTAHIIKSYNQYIDVFVSEHDDGLYDAMNKGVNKSTGDIISILNSDDIYYDDHVLSDVCDFFENNPDIDLLFGAVNLVKSCDTSQLVRQYKALDFRRWMLRVGFAPPHPAIFMRKHVYDIVGEYNQIFKIAADFDFLFRSIEIQSLNYLIIDQPLVKMRMGGVSNNGWSSLKLATAEINCCLKSHNRFSNYLLILLRIPLKLYLQYLKPLTSNSFK